MNLRAALLGAVVAALLLVTACGGGGGSGADPSSTRTGNSDTSGSTPSNNGSASGGSSGGSSASCPFQPPQSVPGEDFMITSSYDAPMVFLAQPGPITATVLAAPPRDDNVFTFRTYAPGGDLGIAHDQLGISSDDDAVGKTVTTASIPAQPAGTAITLQVIVESGRAAFGTRIMTGWPTGEFTCCDLQPKARAQVSFGANNTAIVTFGGPSSALPDIWTTNPLRIQFTNVTSVSGCTTY